MPRKKAAAAAVPGEAPAATFPPTFLGQCPACKSKITVNHHGNAVLHEKSDYLEELLATDAGVDEIEKIVALRDQTIKRQEEAIKRLTAQLEEEVGKTKSEQPAPAPQKETANVGQQKKSWWD
jgi:hypothetical protein